MRYLRQLASHSAPAHNNQRTQQRRCLVDMYSSAPGKSHISTRASASLAREVGGVSAIYGGELLVAQAGVNLAAYGEDLRCLWLAFERAIQRV